MFLYASSSPIGNYEHGKIVSCYGKVNLQPTTWNYLHYVSRLQGFQWTSSIQTLHCWKKENQSCEIQYLSNGFFKFATSIAAELKLIKLKPFLKLSENAKNLHVESHELHTCFVKRRGNGGFV